MHKRRGCQKRDDEGNRSILVAILILRACQATTPFRAICPRMHLKKVISVPPLIAVPARDDSEPETQQWTLIKCDPWGTRDNSGSIPYFEDAPPFVSRVDRIDFVISSVDDEDTHVAMRIESESSS